MKCEHTYDENGLCFDCDAVKPVCQSCNGAVDNAHQPICSDCENIVNVQQWDAQPQPIKHY